MGTIQVKDTHVKRSSGMTSRWKQENRRLLIGTAIIILSLIFVFLVSMYGTKGKNVHLVINGEKSLIHTQQEDFQHILGELNIPVSENDRLSVPLSTKIKNGDTLVLDHATAVRLTVDGSTSTLYTTAETVAEVIKELNIKVNSEDRVSPGKQSRISDNIAIRIVRINKVIEQEKASIDYKTVTQKDANLIKGKQRIIQNGQHGVLVKKLEKQYEDGKLAYVQVLDQSVERPSVNKIIAVGAKSPVVILSAPKPKPASKPKIQNVSLKGINFDFKKILNNVTLTAYSADFESTGKKEGDSQFGITFSGTRVTEGRTIAVDPKVIPIGWWVYIEGLGFRRAEDKGSAIVGKKIDVYFESGEYANKFGLKTGYTVYVVGPVKPETN